MCREQDLRVFRSLSQSIYYSIKGVWMKPVVDLLEPGSAWAVHVLLSMAKQRNGSDCAKRNTCKRRGALEVSLTNIKSDDVISSSKLYEH